MVYEIYVYEYYITYEYILINLRKILFIYITLIVEYGGQQPSEEVQ